MKRAWGNAADRVLLHVKEFGPCTANDILACMELEPNNVRQILHRLGKQLKRGPDAGKRRIHIVKWVHDAEGQREYPRPLWAYGHGYHAKKPERKPNLLVQREHYARTKILRSTNSVFNLGVGL